MSEDLSRNPRARLLAEAIRILDAWRVSDKDQPSLLGLTDAEQGRAYNRIRLGTQKPKGDEVYGRG